MITTYADLKPGDHFLFHYTYEMTDINVVPHLDEPRRKIDNRKYVRLFDHEFAYIEEVFKHLPINKIFVEKLKKASIWI